MKKIIELHIDIESFPYLINVLNDKLGDLCYEIFKKGYDNLFPKQTEISLVDAKIEKIDNIMEQLFGITYNSSKKGKVSEDIVYTFIKSR